MINPHRGEISTIIDGERRTLRLTLGALAELETALDAPDLVALAERFESGKLTAREVMAVLGAGLRGAGGDETDEAVARMSVAGGVTGAVRAVAELLNAAFGAEDAP